MTATSSPITIAAEPVEASVDNGDVRTSFRARDRFMTREPEGEYAKPPLTRSEAR